MSMPMPMPMDKESYDTFSKDTAMVETELSSLKLTQVMKSIKTKPPNSVDPIEWITWYIHNEEVNSCLVQTTYADFELSTTENKSVNGKIVKLLTLSLHRIDDRPHVVPVPTTQTQQVTQYNPQTIATHRRMLLIEKIMKELRIAKKSHLEHAIHGFVIYRLNGEYLGGQQVEQAYTNLVQALKQKKEPDQMIETDEQKIIYVKI